jgi:hypothetical protein
MISLHSLFGTIILQKRKDVQGETKRQEEIKGANGR